MRKARQKLLGISIICCFLLGFTFYYDWTQQTQCPPYYEYRQTDSGSYLARWRSAALNQLSSGGAQNSDSQFNRKAVIKSICLQNNLINSSAGIAPFVSRQLFVEHNHKFIYCEVPKAGCSNWKRIILLLSTTLGASADDLNHEDVHTTPLLTRLSSYSPIQQMRLLKNYNKVMFTRDPFNRLVSAYRDKLLHDEPYYSKTMADIIKSRVRKQGHSAEKVTFEEFVRFIVQENPDYRDTHWKPMYELCDPCNIQYDFVGKFETINEDADYILKAVGAPKELKYPNIKHYPNESRTNDKISVEHLRKLPTRLLQCLTYVYKIDFSMFRYSPMNI
ncbi:carbohydrate sulfotransferase 9-like [Discoglossus pictus]